MFFFVKVRVNVKKIPEFGRILQEGAIPSHPLSTYCLFEDPAVGLNIWEAEDREAFEKAFSPHRPFYSEVLEITPVIQPQEAMRLLLAGVG